MTQQTEQTKALSTVHQASTSLSVGIFDNTQTFEHSMRISKMLAASDLVPTQYKGRVENVMVALEISNRMQVSPLMVMQNLDIIKGKPSFNSKFKAAMINSCGKYEALRHKLTGAGDSRSCVAYARDLRSGELLEGPAVTVAMAKAEGWWSKKDREGKETSKWPTMTDVMLVYRATSFFCNMYEPGLTMGIPTSDELYDITESRTEGEAQAVFQAINKKGQPGSKTGVETSTGSDNEELL